MPSPPPPPGPPPPPPPRSRLRPLSIPKSRTNPHIRLNSNPADLLAQDATEQASTSKTRNISNPSNNQQPPVRRSLIPSFNNPSRQSSGGDVRRMGSAEHLLPPSPIIKQKRYRDRSSRSPSPATSVASSTRSSLESAKSYDRLFAGGVDSDSSNRSSSFEDDGDMNTQTIAARYNITPSDGLLLYPQDIEKDDWLHNPQPGEKDGRECEIFGKRGMINIGGLLLIVGGVLVLFVVWPVTYFVDSAVHPMGPSCAANPNCIRDKVPLLKNVRSKLVDPATPTDAYTRTSKTGAKMNLVFSDEFEVDGRTFYPGDDPYFTAVDLWYGVTADLEWYDPDAITTANGTLTIRFDAFQNHNLNYRSGMLQSWNQMCFKGGYMEASISLPGAGDTIGFWPGFWAMGNLGRPGYASTTDGMWPYSYHDRCDYGITANQSSPDGLSYLPGMRLPACTCNGEDHPSQGNSRSAPEIDAIEASVGFMEAGNQAGVGSASQSGQFAPFDIWYQPDYDYLELFDPTVTTMNNYRGGPFQQAISGVTNLNNSWYNDKEYQRYAFEYVPGGTQDSYIRWFIGDTPTWGFDARAVGPNGNIGQRVIPEEPLAIVANFGMSGNFAELNWTGLATLMPATMRFDYIRIYQDEDGVVGCDPPGYPTTDYIAAHPKAYQNREKLLWSETGYEWPNNSFVHGCAAT